MNQLIRCKNCDQVFMKGPYDACPEYGVAPGYFPENFRPIERDDFQNFLSDHDGHQLEPLKIIEDSYVSEKAYSEPVKVSFFKATNGRERFVVKKFRERIDEPLKYQLIFGDYSLRCITIEIQSDAISKQLENELKPSLSPEKIEAFVRLYGDVVQGLDLEDLERVPEESQHPLEVYYKIDDVHLVYLLRNCRSLFKGQEYLAMEEFIHRHKDDGVLLLKATYKIELVEVAIPEKRTIPALQSSEREKVFSKK